MKLKDFFTIGRNKRNNQQYFILKKKCFRRMGIRPDQILQMKIPKDIKIEKNRKGVIF